MCTFCLWPQTHPGHRWRLQSSTDDVANEVRYALEAFPQVKEISSTTIPSNYQKARTIELCSKLKAAEISPGPAPRASHRITTRSRAMKEAGCRLLIVGYESGDPADPQEHQERRDSRYGAALHANCKKLARHPRRFHRGLPGETPESLRKTIDFAKRLDNETIQSPSHTPIPAPNSYDYAKKNDLITIDR